MQADANRSKASFLALGLVALGCLIAIGGGGAILWSRAAPGSQSVYAAVLPDVPLMRGDTVTFDRDNASCEGVVLATRDDGHVVMQDCQGGLGPMEVGRELLRLPRYRQDLTRAGIGDVVLVATNARFVRGRVVALESNAAIRVQPIRTALDPAAFDASERVVAEREALPVLRASRGVVDAWAPLGAEPLAAGDSLRLRERAGEAPVSVRVVGDASEPARVVVQPDVGDRDGGAPLEVERARLEARILTLADRLDAGDVLLVSVEGVPTRLRVSRPIDTRGEVCAAPEAAPEQACRSVPVTGALRLR